MNLYILYYLRISVITLCCNYACISSVALTKLRHCIYYILQLDMPQIWWWQRNGRQRVNKNDGTDFSRFWVKGTESRSSFKGHIVD